MLTFKTRQCASIKCRRGQMSNFIISCEIESLLALTTKLRRERGENTFTEDDATLK